MYDKRSFIKRKDGISMNFHDKKTRRIIAIVIMLVIVAMVATSVIPYMTA